MISRRQFLKLTGATIIAGSMTSLFGCGGTDLKKELPGTWTCKEDDGTTQFILNEGGTGRFKSTKKGGGGSDFPLSWEVASGSKDIVNITYHAFSESVWGYRYVSDANGAQLVSLNPDGFIFTK